MISKLEDVKTQMFIFFILITAALFYCILLFSLLNPGTLAEAVFFTFTENQRRKVILNACSATGSVSQTHFDLRFNPNICSPGTTHTYTLMH